MNNNTNLTDDLLFINEDDSALSESVRLATLDASAEMARVFGVSFNFYKEVTASSKNTSGALKKFLVLHPSTESASYDRLWLQKTWEIIRDTSGRDRVSFTQAHLRHIFQCRLGDEDERILDWRGHYFRPLMNGLRVMFLLLHLRGYLTLPAKFSAPYAMVESRINYYLYSELPELPKACLSLRQEPEYAQHPSPFCAGVVNHLVSFGFAALLALRAHDMDKHSVQELSNLLRFRREAGSYKDIRKGDVESYLIYISRHVPWGSLSELLERLYGRRGHAFVAKLEAAKKVAKANINLDAMREKLLQSQKSIDGVVESLTKKQILHISKNLTASLFAPNNLQETLSHAGWHIEPDACQIWVKLQEAYLRRKRYESKKTSRPFGLFNVYLFGYLPMWRQNISRNGSVAKLPLSPSEFKGANFWSNLGIQSSDGDPLTFCEFLEELYGLEEKGRRNIYTAWKFLSQFFEYLERQAEALEGCEGFKNPALSGDVPISNRPGATNKMPIPQRFFGLFLRYVYAHLEFVHRTNDKAYEEEIAIPPLTVGKRYWASHEVGDAKSATWGGLVAKAGPVEIEWGGKTYPVEHVPSVFQVQSTNYIGRNGQERHGRLIFPNRLAMVATALETGIRHMHLRWLSCDFDRNAEEGEDLTRLWVKTDKTKKSGWEPVVSFRVISTLRDVRAFRARISAPGFAKELYYQNNPDSKYKKYLPLFSWDLKTGLPASELMDDKIFRKLLLGFQVFLGEHGFGRISLVRLLPVGFEYQELISQANPKVAVKLTKDGRSYIPLTLKSSITPHSTRSSVIRNYLTYLPPEYIGKFITGQTTQTVYYYSTLHDLDYEEYQEKHKRAVAAHANPPIVELDRRETVVADAEDSSLVTAFNRDRRIALKTMGCVVLETGEHKETGLDAILEQPVLAFNKTHICPYNNNCPRKIVEAGIEQRCSLCPYAVKALDHLPAITACMRGTMEQMSRLTTQLENPHDKYSESDLAKLQHERDIMAEDLAGWAMIEHQLWSLYREQDEGGCSTAAEKLVGFEPEIVRKQLKRLDFPSGSVEYILSRLAEDSVFPLFTSQDVQTEFEYLKARLLILQSEQMESMAASISVDPAYELRSMLKSFMEIHELSYPDVVGALSASPQEVLLALGKETTPLIGALEAGNE